MSFLSSILTCLIITICSLQQSHPIVSVRSHIVELDDTTRDEFVAYWREAVHEAALLAHQHALDAGVTDQLCKLLRAMGVRTIALCLSQLWFFSTFNFNFATGEVQEGDPQMWERTARSLHLTSRQVGGCADHACARDDRQTR